MKSPSAEVSVQTCAGLNSWTVRRIRASAFATSTVLAAAIAATVILAVVVSGRSNRRAWVAHLQSRARSFYDFIQRVQCMQRTDAIHFPGTIILFFGPVGIGRQLGGDSRQDPQRGSLDSEWTGRLSAKPITLEQHFRAQIFSGIQSVGQH